MRFRVHMTIPEKAFACNKANIFTESVLAQGNITLPIWYHKLTYGNGKPDSVGITVLSELLHLYLTSGIKEHKFQIGYVYLQDKFNYTYEQVYEAFVRLEKQSLATKKGKLVTLNVKNVLALSDTQEDNDGTSDNTDNNTPKKVTKKLKSLTDKNTKDSSSNIDLYIDIPKRDNKDKKEENYISGISFDKNPTAQNLIQENNPSTQTTGIIKTAKKWVKNLTRKPIASFHPLTEEDAESLRLSSSREFNLHFINQLILRLADKYPNHGFYTKKLFLKYMVSVLTNEMRQAVNVNNEGFRFKATSEEGVAEEYLAYIEDTCGNKASNQIRKKIAASFEPIVAYKILTSCYFPEEVLEDKYEIKQHTSFELSEFQHERLFSQVLAVFGDKLKAIKMTKHTKPQQDLTAKATQAVSLNTETLWGRIRDNLIKHYGEAIDKSWFSRLETTEDANSRSLILKGASFLTDYVKTNYSHVIERLCREENYNLKFC